MLFRALLLVVFLGRSVSHIPGRNRRPADVDYHQVRTSRTFDHQFDRRLYIPKGPATDNDDEGYTSDNHTKGKKGKKGHSDGKGHGKGHSDDKDRGKKGKGKKHDNIFVPHEPPSAPPSHPTVPTVVPLSPPPASAPFAKNAPTTSPISYNDPTPGPTPIPLNPVCFVCGSGMAVVNGLEIFPLPGNSANNLTCFSVQEAGLRGLIAPEDCSSIASDIQETCGCVRFDTGAPTDTPSLQPTSLASSLPSSDSTVAEPTRSQAPSISDDRVTTEAPSEAPSSNPSAPDIPPSDGSSEPGSCPPVPDEGCSICGDGRCITIPDAVFSFPGQPTLPCGTLQTAGEQGLVPLDQCALLASLINITCGCQSSALIEGGVTNQLDAVGQEPTQGSRPGVPTFAWALVALGTLSVLGAALLVTIKWRQRLADRYPVCAAHVLEEKNLYLSDESSTSVHRIGVSSDSRFHYSTPTPLSPVLENDRGFRLSHGVGS